MVLIAPSVYAYKVDHIGTDPGRHDFVVGPGKVDVVLKPGESKTVNLLVSNRMGDERIFSLGVEDFVGSTNLDQPVVLLGNQRGPYSLRDYLHFDEPKFDLQNGQRAIVPVTIRIPIDAEPGGMYGSVLVSTVTKPSDDGISSGARGGTAIVSRIGTLFFVRIPGEIEANGHLEKFQTAGEKKFFTSGPVKFQMLFRNEGSVHLNPYGELHITNLIGDEVAFVEVEPWFAMPDSLRLREVHWDREFLLGRYKVTANINRGYDDVIDTMTLTFWVFPWKIVGGLFVGLIILFLLIKFIGGKFEIKRK